MKDNIQLKNIDLSKISISTEISKKTEEDNELYNALLEVLYEPNKGNYEHVMEEAADVIQTVLSILKIINIDTVEFAEYWNNKHLEKIKNRPR